MPDISILIVEDEAMTAVYLQTMLLRRGYNVLKCVSSGEDAVEFTQKTLPDILIMDIRLAGKMDGIEAASAILNGAEKKINLIFSTGYSDSELRERALLLNPLDFLIKPVNLPELISVIEKSFKE